MLQALHFMVYLFMFGVHDSLSSYYSVHLTFHVQYKWRVHIERPCYFSYSSTCHFDNFDNRGQCSKTNPITKNNGVVYHVAYHRRRRQK